MQQVLSSSVNQTFRCPHPGAQTSRQIIDGVDGSSVELIHICPLCPRLEIDKLIGV